MVAFFETLFDLSHLLDCRKLPLPMLSLPIHSISQLSNLEPAAGPPVARRGREEDCKPQTAKKKNEGNEARRPRQRRQQRRHKHQKHHNQARRSFQHITKQSRQGENSEDAKKAAKANTQGCNTRQSILFGISTLVGINSCSYLAKAYHATS